MKKQFVRFAAFLAVCVVSSLANAAIVVTPVSTSVTVDPGNAFADVTIRIFGRFDGNGVPGTDDRVGRFALQGDVTTLNGGPIAIQSATPVTMGTNLTTTWAGLDNTGRTSFLGSQVNFGGEGLTPGSNVLLPHNVAIANNNLQAADTFIGQFVYRVTQSGNYTVTFNSGNSVFARSLNLGEAILAESFGTVSTSINLTAIPEPSSFALVGLGAVAYWARRRRSAK